MGDPVFMRTLYCENKQGPVGCDMVEVVLSRTICPVVVQGYSYRTEDGDLQAERHGDRIDVEVRGVKGVTKIRLALMTDLIGKKIVQQASGVITFHTLEGESMRAAELIAFAKNSKGLEKNPEHVEIDLGCSKVSVVAAKNTPRL